VAANLLAIENKDADGMALNIGSGRPISIRQIAAVLSSALGCGITAEITGKYRAGDIRHCFADISAATRLLGYKPVVEFRAGIRELAAWLESQTAEDRASEAVEKLDVFGLTA